MYLLAAPLSHAGDLKAKALSKASRAKTSRAKTSLAKASPALTRQSIKVAMPPDILLLGDSQLAFGAGPVFFKFFKQLTKACAGLLRHRQFFAKLDAINIRVMGVRSTSLRHWTTNRWSAKKMVCQEDPKWAVNARLYGFPANRDGTYVQIGHARGFRYCKPKSTALNLMLHDPAARPRLLFMYFMGNAVGHWSKKSTAQEDVRTLTAALPRDLPCIFMTTSPTYRKSINRRRLKAQRGIKAAFEAGMGRCQFIPGLDPKTIAAIEGHPAYFRKHPSGKVKDPYHLNKAGAVIMGRLKRDEICRAVAVALGSSLRAGH